jgi:uncharacterized membrane protein (Fun14 family)
MQIIGAENLYPVAVTIGGILIGYALKKVLKVVAVVIGLFFAGLAYLQYQQIIDIKWGKFQVLSQNAITTLANAMTQIPGFNTGNHAATLAMTNFGIPLTGSMSMGIAIGFMKG